jgi:hypothetical protein
MSWYLLNFSFATWDISEMWWITISSLSLLARNILKAAI